MIKVPTMTHATLPEGLADADHSIASMDVGEGGWTVPWAMWVGPYRALWLNGRYTIQAQSGGTAQMYVWRDEAGWHVDASCCRKDEQWGEGRYVGGALPVAVATFTR